MDDMDYADEYEGDQARDEVDLFLFLQMLRLAKKYEQL